MVMVHVKVVEEVTGIVEVVSVMDKHVYKVKDEISRELTKEVRFLHSSSGVLASQIGFHSGSASIGANLCRFIFRTQLQIDA